MIKLCKATFDSDFDMPSHNIACVAFRDHALRPRPKADKHRNYIQKLTIC